MIRVPKEAFVEDGEEVMPEVGEDIDLSGLAGTVKAVHEDGIDLDVKAINGVPVSYVEGKKEEEKSEDPMKDELMRAAKEKDEEEGYA